MVNYKLTYFDIRGLAEPARLLFQYGGINFEDNRIEFKDWEAVKPTTPTGKLPYMEVDGKILSESLPIYRLLAKKVGLVPSCDWENAQMESVIEWYRDYQIHEIRPYSLAFMGIAPGDKDKLYKEVFVPARDRVFPRLQEILSKSKSGYLADSGLSWGDFYLAESILTMQTFDPEFAKKYPKIVEYQKKVLSTEKIKNYVNNRKESGF